MDDSARHQLGVRAPLSLPDRGPVRGASLFGYAYSSKVAEKVYDELPSPESHTLIYDSSNLARNASDAVTSLPNPPRHRGRNNIAYADGHARSENRTSVTRSSARYLR